MMTSVVLWTNDYELLFMGVRADDVEGAPPSVASAGALPGTGSSKKSQMRIVLSWELLTICSSSNCRRNTRPECSWGEKQECYPQLCPEKQHSARDMG